MKRLFIPVSNRLAVLALGGAVVLAGSALAFTQKAPPKITPVSLIMDERPVAREDGGRTSFAPIVKKVSPAVVKIVTSIKGAGESTSDTSGNPGMDDFLRHFYGNQFEGRMPNRHSYIPNQEGIGSG